MPMMDRNQWPQAFGQSLWLDNITRELLDGGGLQQYIDVWSISGLTSNPSIFDAAIGGSTAYDQSIREGGRGVQSAEALFMELALADLRRAAELLRPAFDASDGVEGWGLEEVRHPREQTPPTPFARPSTSSVGRAPQTCMSRFPAPPRLVAIENRVRRGPVKGTLLFSCRQYGRRQRRICACRGAWMQVGL